MSFISRILGVALLAAALSPAVQASPEQEAANKAAVLAFYEKGLNQKDADAAVKYLGDRYIPVSYTHLDVYKRQIRDRLWAASPASRMRP